MSVDAAENGSAYHLFVVFAFYMLICLLLHEFLAEAQIDQVNRAFFFVEVGLLDHEVAGFYIAVDVPDLVELLQTFHCVVHQQQKDIF
jgi:hypothetical protein